jgi:hypothetical protein
MMGPSHKPSRGTRRQRFVPTSLFARALLILLVPVVVLQLLVAHIFYDRHWNSVVRNMSTTTAADVAMLLCWRCISTGGIKSQFSPRA